MKGKMLFDTHVEWDLYSGMRTTFALNTGRLQYVTKVHMVHYHHSEPGVGSCDVHFHDHMDRADATKLYERMSKALEGVIGGHDDITKGVYKYAGFGFRLPSNRQFVRGVMELIFKPLFLEELGLQMDSLPPPHVFQETLFQERGFMPTYYAQIVARKAKVWDARTNKAVV